MKGLILDYNHSEAFILLEDEAKEAESSCPVNAITVE